MDADLLNGLLSRLPLSGWTESLPGAARLVGILITVPVFSSRLLPWRLRIAFLLLVLLSLPGLRPPGGMGAPEAPAPAALSAVAELFVGAAIGWWALLSLAAARGAAVFLSDQIGFSLGGVMDPLAEEGQHPLRSFHAALAIFIFLAANMHHAFLRLFSESLAILPPGTVGTSGVEALLPRAAALGGAFLLEAAFQIALPVLAVLLLVSVVQGILTRAVPELEFFVFGFPIRAVAGIAAIVATLPAFAALEEGLFRAALEEGRQSLRILAG
jgi:flagellar biosynthetic protein FliR